jgi:hypothetical protein
MNEDGQARLITVSRGRPVQDLPPHPDRFAQSGNDSRWIGDYRRKQLIDLGCPTTRDNSGVALGDKVFRIEHQTGPPW